MTGKRELWARVRRWARGGARYKPDLIEQLEVARLLVENRKLRDTIDGLYLDMTQTEASRDYQTDARMAERDRADKLAEALTRLRKLIQLVWCPSCREYARLSSAGHMLAHYHLYAEEDKHLYAGEDRSVCPMTGRRPEDTVATTEHTVLSADDKGSKTHDGDPTEEATRESETTTGGNP